MTAYEMMLSESQERMLMVLRPEQEAEAEAIFRKWGLDFAVVGRTTDDLRFRVLHKGKVEADLPIKDLGDQAPEYDRPYTLRERRRRRSPKRFRNQRITARRLIRILELARHVARAAGSGSNTTT